MCEGSRSIFEEKKYFRFATAVGQNECFNKIELPNVPHKFASRFELLCNITTLIITMTMNSLREVEGELDDL